MIEAQLTDIGQNWGVRKGVGHFKRKFQGERGPCPPTTLGVRKLESLRYHVAFFA